MNRSEGELVLVVDDDERNAKLARDVLRAAGLRTLEARSGAEAIALARRHDLDVILLDVRLPDLDGVEVARRLKEDARTAAIPVVALTALTTAPEGFDGHLEKPIDVHAFPAQVRSFCRAQR